MQLSGGQMLSIFSKRYPGRVIQYGEGSYNMNSSCGYVNPILSPDGESGLIVTYGSTGIHNTFEMLQLAEVSRQLGLNAVMAAEPAAGLIKQHWNRVFNPSLKVLMGKEASRFGLNWMGLTGKHKLTQGLDSEKVYQGLNKAEFVISEQIGQLAESQSYFGLYANVMSELQRLLDLSHLGFIDGDQIIKNRLLGKYVWETAHSIQQGMSGPFRVCNLEGSQAITTRHIPRDLTWDQVYADGGWPSGAVLYYLNYSLSECGPVAMMVKDTKTGNVHYIAELFLKQGLPLYLVPTNTVRLRAVGQEQDFIDPIVLLELSSRWGEVRFKQVIGEVMSYMHAGLPEGHKYGSETVVEIDLNGIADVRTG